MPYQEEPGNKGSRELTDLGLTTSEINALLRHEDGHGLCNYLADNCWGQVSSGQNLKTPFRVLLVCRMLRSDSSRNDRWQGRLPSCWTA